METIPEVGTSRLSTQPLHPSSFILHPFKVVVVGGGVSGLAAAHRLIEQSAGVGRAVEVTLLEASGRLGGVVQTTRRDGFLLEGGPDAFISEKPEALRLAERLGIASQLIETNAEHRRSFIVRNGRLRPVPEGFRLLAPSQFWSFLTSDVFSLQGKARMALDLVLPRGSKSEEESLAAFVRRRFGREALERMAQPMVAGIYTADPEQLSLQATMPRFLKMERDQRSVILALWRAQRRERRARQQRGEQAASGTSGARYSLFLSFADGMKTLTNELARRLPQEAIRLHTAVESLQYDEATKKWCVGIRRTDSSSEYEREVEFIQADAVCLALPAHASAKLLANVNAELAGELASIPYASTATINFAYRRADITHPLNGFGFVVPFIERRAVLACSFSSVKFPGRAPEDHALLRAFVGGALQPEMFALNDAEMIASAEEDLRSLLGITAAPLFTSLTRWKESMAQYHLGHLARINLIRERLAAHTNLYLIGNLLDGAGIPDCIRHGEAVANQIITSEVTVQ